MVPSTKTEGLVLDPKPVQLVTCAKHSLTFSLFSLITAPHHPWGFQIHRNPLTSGHSMVNILFCSSMIKRNPVSSEMLEVPYGERNIIISLSSSCTHVLTQLLKPHGLCSQSPNQGERSWEHSPETYSQKFRLWLPWRAPPCASPVCVSSEHVLSQLESASHNSPKEPQGQALLPSHSRGDVTEWCVQKRAAG